MQTVGCTWRWVVPVGEDLAAHGHWCTFTDLCHAMPCHHLNRAPMVVTEGSAACAVKARAQTIQREHERKAAAADIKFNGTLPGAQGPIAAKLASFGLVHTTPCHAR